VQSFEFTLDAQQQAVVDSDARAIQVIASAGAGKTEVIARRIERLTRESDGEFFKVLALSYTGKAAGQMRVRLEDRLGGSSERVQTETLHGLAHRLLREGGTRLGLPLEPQVLARNEDRAEALSQWLERNGHRVLNDIAGVLFDMDKDFATRTETAQVVQWRQVLHELGALDYPTMIEKATELVGRIADRRLIRQRYRHLIVDEAQNLTAAQYELVKAIAGTGEEGDAMNVALVGDAKQSVVEFAGGHHEHFLAFQDDFSATQFRLTMNYRSAERIVALGRAVAHDLGHEEPTETESIALAATGLVNHTSFANEQEEAAGVADWVAELLGSGIPEPARAPTDPVTIRAEEIAVLGRTNGVLRLVYDELEGRGIAVATAVASDSWLSTVEAKVSIEVMSLLEDGSNMSAKWELGRLLSLLDQDWPDDEVTQDVLADLLAESANATFQPLRAFLKCENGQEFLEQLRAVSEAEQLRDHATWWDDVELIESAWRDFTMRVPASEQSWQAFRVDLARQWQGRDLDPGVRLLTIQKAQGSEFRAVCIVGMNEGQLPDFRARTAEKREAELRIFYVAGTRPSRVLLLARAETRDTRFGPRKTDPSPYLRYAQLGVAQPAVN